MAIDIVARGLATALVGEDGKIATEKMPTFGEAPEGVVFSPLGQLKDPNQIIGKTAEEVLLMMLYGVVNPTLTNPSLRIALSDKNEVPIIGRPSVLKGALTFSRGKINPAFTTSGYRTGAPSVYSVGGQTYESNKTSYDFEFTFTPTEKKMQIPYSVTYGEGEQPVNSAGQPFGAPYPAGTINSSIAVTCAYAFYSQNEEHPFIWFEDEDGSGYLSAFSMENSDEEKQSFMVSSELTVIGIKAFNTMTNQWEWLGNSQAVSLTHFDTTIIPGDTLGETTDYILYTHNRNRVGERELRIYVQ